MFYTWLNEFCCIKGCSHKCRLQHRARLVGGLLTSTYMVCGKRTSFEYQFTSFQYQTAGSSFQGSSVPDSVVSTLARPGGTTRTRTTVQEKGGSINPDQARNLEDIKLQSSVCTVDSTDARFARNFSSFPPAHPMGRSGGPGPPHRPAAPAVASSRSRTRGPTGSAPARTSHRLARVLPKKCEFSPQLY